MRGSFEETKRFVQSARQGRFRSRNLGKTLEEKVFLLGSISGIEESLCAPEGGNPCVFV